MVIIRVIDVTPACDTAQQGEALRRVLLPALQVGEVTLSFSGIVSATSSFVNTALVEILKSISFDRIKADLRVVDATRQINDMVKTRMMREAERLQPAGY